MTRPGPSGARACSSGCSGSCGGSTGGVGLGLGLGLGAGEPVEQRALASAVEAGGGGDAELAADLRQQLQGMLVHLKRVISFVDGDERDGHGAGSRMGGVGHE